MLSFRLNSEVQEAIKKTMAGTRVILRDSSFAHGRVATRETGGPSATILIYKMYTYPSKYFAAIKFRYSRCLDYIIANSMYTYRP